MAGEIRLGTSSFTADGWNGAFYPKGMKSADYLRYYSTRFDTVEVDSTFYRCPTTEAVKMPPGFIFSLKIPQTNMRFLARANELYTSVSLLESTNPPENLTNLLLIAAGLGEAKSIWQRPKRVRNRGTCRPATLSGESV
jgi:uncharacterized protein YecE (DUF72 family)